MARGSSESTSDLYIRLGLSTNEFESGFVDAERTLHDNMARLNREMNLVELRAQVEINGLDETADQMQILTIRTRSLSEQIRAQRDRIRLTNASLQSLTQSQGASAMATQNMEARLRREQLALQRLEEQLRRTQQAQQNLNNTSSAGGAGAGGAGSTSTGGTSGAGNSGGYGGLEDLVDGVLDKIPPQARIAAAAIAGLGTAITSAGNASAEMIRKWGELQKQSYELNMSVNDTENFLHHMKLAGGDIGDFEGFIRGISDAMAKGEWDDPEAMVFRRYGETAFDENGRIKGFQEMTETIKRMYDQAKAAGEEIEFLQMLGGESGIRDAIQYFELYEEAKEDAEKIFDAGLDPEEMHESLRALNLLTMQVDEFKDAALNIITPATTLAMKGLFEVVHDGTESLVEGKEELQRWGFIAAETFDTVVEKLKILKAAYDELPNMGLLDKLPEEATQFGGLNALSKEKDYAADALFGDIIERAEEEQDKYNSAVEEGAKSWGDFRREQEQGVQTTKEITAATEEATNAKQKEIDVLQQYSIQRERDLRDELQEVKLENENFKHSYDLEVAKLALERERARRQNVLSTGESNAIDELYYEKRLLLEQETQDRLDDLRNEATEEFKTDLEKRIIEIENAMDDWIDAGMEEAEAEKYAQALKAKAIKDLEEEWAAAVLAINGSALEQKLANIEKEKQAWIDKGIAEVEAEQWAQEAKAKVMQAENDRLKGEYESAVQAEQNAAQRVESAEEALNDALEQREELRQRIAEKQAQEITQAEQGLQVLKSQLEAFRAYRDGGEKGLQDYYLKQLRKQGITDKDLQMTPQQLEGFQQASRDAQKSLMPNLEQVAPPDPEMLKQLSKLDDRIAKLQDSLAAAKQALEDATAKRKEAEYAYKNQAPQEEQKSDTVTVTEEIKNPDGSTTINQHKALREDVEKELGTEFQKALDDAGNSAEDFKKKLDDVDTSNLQEPETPATTPDLTTPETPSIPVDFSDIAAKFDILPQIIENISSGLDDLTPKINDVSTAFGDLFETLQNTDKDQLSDVPSAPVELSEIMQPALEILSALQTDVGNIETTLSNKEQAAPPNITNNIHIEEAHAWDYDHISYLAEKVADIIEPRILSAIGGDSNGY